MKTLYLHIGTTKTATSSIQHFLYNNREVLAQHGYCFPPLLRPYPYLSSTRNAHFMIGNQYKEDGSRDRALEKEILLEGMRQVIDCFKQYDNVVLTDEALWRVSSHSHKGIFPYIMRVAKKYKFTVKVIVYLRRQDGYLTSGWNQLVKQSTTALTSTFDERLERVLEKESYVIDYAAKLDSMAEVFGKENLIVRRFEPKYWLNGSIIDDFMNCIGLAITEDFIPLEQTVNPGLSGNTAEIKRIINKDATFTTDENRYFAHILKDLSFESGKRYPSSMLSAEESRELMKQFEEGNAKVAQEYMQDGDPLFSDQFKNVPKWEPDNPYMMEDVIRFFSMATIDLRRENERLRNELKDLRAVVAEDKKDLRTFKYKIKHPFRALWNRLFHRNSTP